MGCVGEVSGSMCYPDAQPDAKAAGCRIMRLQLTITVKKKVMRRQHQAEEGENKGMEAGSRKKGDISPRAQI